MNTPLLEMRGITKEFPGVLALDDVSLCAWPGEILAIVGENGAGKSTLMKVLSGAYSPDTYDGTISIDGKQVCFSDTSQSEAAGIAMIYQEINMHLDLTVAENMFVGRWPVNRIGGVDWPQMRGEAVERLKEVELDLDPQTKLRNLNTSQLQLISIARALSKKPRLLVLDEPTSALTQTESATLFAILQRLKGEGIACILITHKLEEVFAQSDRVIVMRDGCVTAEHKTAETDREAIILEMVGRSFENYYPKRNYVPQDVILRIEDFVVPHPYSDARNIVEHVSFSLRRGEILGLAGLVGSGRSELVNAIYGKSPASKGEVYLEGVRITIDSPKDALRHGIALVTEDRKVDGYIGKLGVKQNISIASLDSVSKRGVIDSLRESRNALRFAQELEIRAPSIETLLDTLSGGNQQKVVLSKCLQTLPLILILDEPTKGIDVAAKHTIYNEMVSLADKGVSILMISSELPELVSMCNRVVVLSYGRYAGELSGEQINQVEIMRLATKNL